VSEHWTKAKGRGSFRDAGHPTAENGQCPICYSEGYEAAEAAQEQTKAMSEQRRWHASGNRMFRQSAQGDLPGGDDEFPILNEGVAEHLAEVLNEDLAAQEQTIADLHTELQQAAESYVVARMLATWRAEVADADARIEALITRVKSLAADAETYKSALRIANENAAALAEALERITAIDTKQALVRRVELEMHDIAITALAAHNVRVAPTLPHEAQP